MVQGIRTISVATRTKPQFITTMRRLNTIRTVWGLACLFLGSASVKGQDPANTLAAQEKASGWTFLFDGKTTQGWRSFHKQTFPQKGWTVDAGWLYCQGQGGGDIISEGEFSEFELSWEWKLESGGNSGVKYFVLESRKSAIGHEYQLLDDDLNEDGHLGDGKRVTAAFYDVLKPMKKTPTRPMGEVNQSRIVVRDHHVEHWLNGEKVLDYECGSDAVKAAVAQSKFKNTAGFGDCASGHILLQDHGSKVWFRNIKIRQLLAR